MKPLLVTLLVLGSNSLFLAQGSQQDLLDQYIAAWEEASAQEDFSKSFEWHDKACALAKAENKLDVWLYLITQRGGLLGGLQKNQFEAWNYLEKSLREMWRQPSNQKEYYELCYLFMNQAYVAKQHDEDFVRNKIALENAYQAFHKGLKGQSDEVAAYLYYQLGNAYVRLKEFNSARKIFEEGLAYSLLHDVPEVAKYNDFAGMYVSMGEYHLAQKIFLQGISRKNMSEEDMLFTKLGYVECLAYLREFDHGLALNREVEKSLSRPLKSEETKQKLPEFMSQVQENYALLYEKKGEWNKAILWYQKTFQTAKAYPKSAKRSLGYYLLSIGNLYLEHNKADQALPYFQNALRTVIPQLPSDLLANPSANWMTAETVVLRALYGKAKTCLALGNPDLALECYELIPAVEAKIRSTHIFESSSLLTLKESRQRFQEAIELAWLLYERSNGNQVYARRAFRLTELARGMLLLQSLMQARQYLPDEIKNKDYELRAQIAWLEHEIANEQAKHDDANRSAIAGWEQRLFERKLERQKLLAAFPSYNHPDAAVLEVLAAREVPGVLRKDQALISYFFTETAAFVFSCDPSGRFEWRKNDLTPDFRNRTRALVQYLWDGREKGKDVFLQNASLLYEGLLKSACASLGAEITSLVIMPDDVLMMLPFEVLLTQAPSPDEPNWRDQPWLLWRYNIAYGYSATLLKAQMDISKAHSLEPSKPPKLYGGFAPEYAQSGEYPLQNTSGMVKSVQKILRGDAWTAVSDQEALFKEKANQYRILLLAMHGISNPEQPELSRLLFGDPGPDSSANNNILYASELQIMQLRADLVVLSACHSGSGKLEQGEGVYSLARAFAAAGVPATVMSMWLLHENAAPPLVESFFSNLTRGMTKDEALRRSKQEYLKNDAYFELTHPFYWAGLVATGDMQPVAFSGKTYLSWWLGVGALLLVLMSWFFIKNRTKTNIRA